MDVMGIFYVPQNNHHKPEFYGADMNHEVSVQMQHSTNHIVTAFLNRSCQFFHFISLSTAL